jgi:hypothetical protein
LGMRWAHIQLHTGNIASQYRAQDFLSKF